MNPAITPAAFVGMRIPDFVAASRDAILGRLTAASKHDVELSQRDAWQSTITILQLALANVAGYIFLEFDVPRLGSRIDAVIISAAAIIPIEFKIGEDSRRRDAIDQVWDYALDLKNFHKASHDAPIFPILIPSAIAPTMESWGVAAADGVSDPVCGSPDEIGRLIDAAVRLATGPVIDPIAWGRAPYHPTPTIVEAARALYSGHSVDAIARSDAGARNLAETSLRVDEIITDAERTASKAIVFVTGVPGAGKTLVGLNIATDKRDATSETHAVYLSGNGPLVAVLRAALIKDELQRRRTEGLKAFKKDAEQPVKQFIQNVHHFRDEGIRDPVNPPSEHVAIFDEAQRAWNREMTSDFMRRKKGHKDFNESEAEFLISCLDRHSDWAVVVCLVGGGQEINKGEDGIASWLDAIARRFPQWKVYASTRLADAEYAAMESIEVLAKTSSVRRDPSLHLAVSMRSFRAEKVSDFVKAVLDLEADQAPILLRELASRYPIAVTRDLDLAKRWLRSHARGNERYGLVASSQAMRLKPHAIDVRVKTDPVHWFLDDRTDTRSSYYLEDPATEFQVQGLELDWVCVTWDADLRRTRAGWGHFRFRGDQWQRRHQPDSHRYLLNAYRVLLTRARQGMVIFVPPGDANDPTRLPDFYDPTYQYLAGVGIASL